MVESDHIRLYNVHLGISMVEPDDNLSLQRASPDFDGRVGSYPSLQRASPDFDGRVGSYPSLQRAFGDFDGRVRL